MALICSLSPRRADGSWVLLVRRFAGFFFGTFDELPGSVASCLILWIPGSDSPRSVLPDLYYICVPVQ